MIESGRMESYLKSWEGIVKEYHNLSRNKCKYGMKNSLELEADGEKVACNESCADSLPIHCIVQTFSSLSDLKLCHSSFDCPWECQYDTNDVTACIVLPEDTPISDLLRTALVKLGYPASVSSFATGSILIRNWKPLPLDLICPDMKKTVGDILGEITSVVNLRIQIFKPKITAAQKMKDSLLLFLINANHNFLRESRCPFDLGLLSKLCEGSSSKMQLLQEPGEELQRKLESWLEEVQEMEKATVERKNQVEGLLSGGRSYNGSSRQYPGGERRVESPRVESRREENNGGEQQQQQQQKGVEKDSLFVERSKQFPTPKTRVRTSFDPEFELPKLQKWFLKNPHPSRQQIYEYVAELNSLDSRKGRKQLDVNNVVYWFKNARAAQKRTECRKFSASSAPETNRCNVLKIPSGKNCGVTSDDQRSVSDDEASATSESGDDYRQENGRSLQVVGKWNSNGLGEAVLEMQIPSRKNEFSHGKKEKTSDGEETCRNVQEEDYRKESWSLEKKDPEGTKKNSDEDDCREIQSVEENLQKNDINGNRKSQAEETKPEVSSKGQLRTAFPSIKENGVITDSEFLPPYQPPTGFPMGPGSVLSPSFMCMPPYLRSKPGNIPLSSEERRKRNRTFIDPVTEVPRLEQWFRLSTHPSHNLIARYTEELNNMSYRRKFPKLEAKNVQFWFKNRRAKNKRLNYLETNNN